MILPLILALLIDSKLSPSWIPEASMIASALYFLFPDTVMVVTAFLELASL